MGKHHFYMWNFTLPLFGKFSSNLENILGRRKDTLNVLYIFKKKKKAKGVGRKEGRKEVSETYHIL